MGGSVNKLKQKGLLKRVGPDKGGHGKLKYKSQVKDKDFPKVALYSRIEIGIFKNKLIKINTNSLTNTSKEHIL